MIERSRRSRTRDTVVFGVSVKSGGGAAYVPLLTVAADGTPTSDGATGASVDTDTGNGRLYWAVVTDGGSATTGQIKAGTGGNIVAAGNQAVTASGTQTFNITGLSAATQYQIKTVQMSAANIDSAQASVGLLTTA